MQKHGVIEKLCELFATPHMATSVRLLVLRSLDSLLDYPQGLERFVGWGDGLSGGESPYQSLLELLLTQPVSLGPGGARTLSVCLLDCLSVS